MQDKKWQVADTLDYALLKEHARENRGHPTEAENVFWSLAKGGGFGQKCRRQYIIGQYIVDFFFREANLIVELDGGYHFTEEQQAADVDRQAWLENMGYRIVRFKNEEVLFETEDVIMAVKNYLQNNNSITPSRCGGMMA